jgi:hypothetical protein
MECRGVHVVRNSDVSEASRVSKVHSRVREKTHTKGCSPGQTWCRTGWMAPKCSP